MDIWRRIRPKAKSAELMIVGRVSTLVLICVAVAWIPIVKSSSELFHYIQSVTSYLAPPVCMVYLLAFFWPRFNEMGAFYALMVGLGVGLVRFIWEAIYPRSSCGQQVMEYTTARMLVTKVHYLHFSIVLFAISGVVAWIVTICTKPLPKKFTQRLTFWTRHEPPEESLCEERGTRPSITSAPNLQVIEVEQDELETEPSKPRRPWYMVAVYWICGIESNTESSQEAVVEELTLDIEEKPSLMLISEISAALLLTVVAFVWGFFA